MTFPLLFKTMGRLNLKKKTFFSVIFNYYSSIEQKEKTSSFMKYQIGVQRKISLYVILCVMNKKTTVQIIEI